MPGEHWLSYSSSDQAVLRDRDRGVLWDRLVVPATLATYYKQGTGGFVLELRRPFVIDPRTPIIQPIDVTRPPDPKPSHKSLAAIHDPDVCEIWAPGPLGPGQEVPLEFWTADRWTSAVNRVLRFQHEFEWQASEKRDKYAAMLREVGYDLDAPVEGPWRLIPPYWAVGHIDDGWWALCRQAVEQGHEFARNHNRELVPILCITHEADPDLLGEMIARLPRGLDQVLCWRGGWDETLATSADVLSWQKTIEIGGERGVAVHNLYGGALSVAMIGLGLAGVNHGIGYSESRDERRLAQTGAPPMRYYMPTLREFQTVPTAQLSLSELGADHWCRCPVCVDLAGEVLRMSNEELKAHFLHCRAREFAAADDLRANIDDFERVAEELYARFTPAQDREDEPDPFSYLFERANVLRNWAAALEAAI
ncbi:MAG: hypothetical protein Q8K79_18280 [Solirubrobacteraceae bacterium]|nr:hypothetical protein [Solirubrobacteraceae bacterium]